MFNLLRLLLLVIIALAVVIYLRPDLLERAGITLPQQQSTPQPTAPPVAETELAPVPAQAPAPVTKATAAEMPRESFQPVQPQETGSAAAAANQANEEMAVTADSTPDIIEQKNRQATESAVEAMPEQLTEAPASEEMAAPATESLQQQTEMPLMPAESTPASEVTPQQAPAEATAPVTESVAEPAVPVSQPVIEQVAAPTEFTPESVVQDAATGAQTTEPESHTEELKEKAMEQLLETFGNEPVKPAMQFRPQGE